MFRTRLGANGCVEWIGGMNSNGYGHAAAFGRQWQVHRLAWFLDGRPLDPNLDVLHHCDNPICLNVDHLFQGTDQDNADDRMTKNGGTDWQIEHAEKKIDWKDVSTIAPRKTKISKLYSADDIEKMKGLRMGGFTYRSISLASGVPHHRVREVLIGAGVPVRSRVGNGSGGYPEPSGGWKDENTDRAISMIKSGMSYASIAREMGVPYPQLYYQAEQRWRPSGLLAKPEGQHQHAAKATPTLATSDRLRNMREGK